MSVGAEDRDRLERLCRYILRPPVVEDRLELLEDGRILMELKTPFWDGSTHILFEPLEFLEKLAAVIPRPRVNLMRPRHVVDGTANASFPMAPKGLARRGSILVVCDRVE